jgi:Spy/CpxP family protein refolding chaperone
MRTIPFAALALALSVSTTTLVAQPGRGARADAPRDRAMLGARGGGSPAEALLRQRTQLELTAEQVTRLEALAQTQRTARSSASPGQPLRLRADLMDAMAGDGNLQAARAALDKLSAAQNERIIAGLRAQQDARAVLTPTQRAKVNAARGPGNRFAMQGAGRRGPGNVQGARGPQGRTGAVRPNRTPNGVRGNMPGRRPDRPVAPPARPDDTMLHGN